MRTQSRTLEPETVKAYISAGVGYHVTVTNIGTVAQNVTHAVAREVYREYVSQADAGIGRAEHPVVLWEDGEPVQESETSK